jgi:hypothetical protein
MSSLDTVLSTRSCLYSPNYKGAPLRHTGTSFVRPASSRWEVKLTAVLASGEYRVLTWLTRADISTH